MSRRWRIVLLVLSLMAAWTSLNASGPAEADPWRAEFQSQLDSAIERLEASRAHHIQEGVPAPGATPVAPLPTLNRFPGSSKLVSEQAIAGLLQVHGLPPGLASVVAVESAFDPFALSPKGARGLWQFMPETARRYGLKVEANHDERTDPLKSTHAAAAYIRDLYFQFGDWPLVFAAYNTGEDRVAKALARTAARDFWSLQRQAALPEETLEYVPAILGRLKGPLTAPEPATSASETSAAEVPTMGRVTYATASSRLN